MIVTAMDCETTGLIDNRLVALDKQPSVIEFYACRLNLETGEIGDELDFLVKPPPYVKDLDPKVAKVTGLKMSMLQDALVFSDRADDVDRFLSLDYPIIAHNASFDREVIDIEFDRLQRKRDWPRLICTIEQTMHLKGYRLSLSALHELLFDEKFKGAHRAKVDVAALCRCATELFKRGMIR